MSVFARGQRLHFRLRLYDLNGLPEKQTGTIKIKLEINKKLSEDAPKEWSITTPYSTDVKILNHTVKLKETEQQELKADYLYHVTIQDESGAINVSSHDGPAKILEKSRYVEHRVSNRLRTLGFHCTHVGGTGRPDIIARHPQTEREDWDVEVNYSEDKYTLEKFLVDLEKFQRYATKEPKMCRLLIVHCGAYVERGVLNHLNTAAIKTANVTIISLRSLADLAYSVNQRILPGSEALVQLMRRGEVKYRSAGSPAFDPVPDPYPVDLSHAFLKKRFELDEAERGRPPASRVLALRDIAANDVYDVLHFASEHHDEYRTRSRFSVAFTQHILATHSGRIVPATSWARTLQGLGLLDARCKLTQDGTQLLKLWETRARKAAEERLAFHFISGPHVLDLLVKANNATMSKTRYPNKQEFLAALGRQLTNEKLTETAAAGTRVASEVLSWAEQLHLSPGWDVKLKLYLIDIKRIERIYKDGGQG